ncbi:MAG: isopentenyl phosphate kinase [Candidatus Bathyarchaeia archaeon]
MVKDLLIIKLGGSVITNKLKKFKAKISQINKICKMISDLNERMILIHGGGSFAHPIAKKYKLNLGYENKNQLIGYSEIKVKLMELSEIILKALKKNNLPSILFFPSSFIIAKNGRIFKMDLEPLKMLLELEITPLLSGDIVPDYEKGFSIISGDQIAVELALRLKAEKVIFGCDVDGIFTKDPKKNKNAEIIPIIKPSMFKDIVKMINISSCMDVTYGMLGKLKESIRLAENGIEAAILNLNNPNNLKSFIEGKKVLCTRILPD